MIDTVYPTAVAPESSYTTPPGFDWQTTKKI